MSPGVREESPPPRRRVTARQAQRVSSPTAAIRKSADTESPTSDIGAIYLRTLFRAQLRLAIVCCVGFALTVATAAVIIATVPTLHETYVGGVPWSWVLQAYGMYPIVALFAALYVRAATRNEKSYRLLEESG